ncbi:hypothetical protein CRUP_030239 [Coryphaenoides rupestris]|nr:hypothetical protein CRUP_030239 [Coryphaenoides rupestris]
MNIITFRNAIFNVAGQLRRQVVAPRIPRTFCSKPQVTKADLPPTAPANTNSTGFKIPGYRPSEMDKKLMIWSGRFKTADQIPEFVSIETMNAARNRMRVKGCYVMIVITIVACLGMIISGKRAAGRHESLVGQNMERKAKWRQDYLEEQQQKAVATMSGKAE